MRNVLSALRVFEEVCKHEPIGVSELARLLELPKTTAQRCLLTLGNARWLEPTSGDPVRWQVSSHARRVVGKSQRDMSLRDLARPVMEKVRDELDETIHLVVRDGFECLLIERADGTKPVRAFSPLGISVPLHGPSSGKIILAYLTTEEQDAYLSGELENFTPETLSSTAKLRADIERTLERGYSVNRGEWRAELSGIGVPIFGRDGTLAGALSVSMPSFRFDEASVTAMAKTLVTGAREIGTGFAGRSGSAD